MIRRSVLLLLFFIITFAFLGCEVRSTSVDNTRIEVPADADLVVRLWLCDQSGYLAFDGESCMNNKMITARASPRQTVALRYPGYDVIKIEQGKDMYGSNVYTVFYAYLRPSKNH